MEGLTPMMKQYLEVKDEYDDYIVLYRLGANILVPYVNPNVLSQTTEIFSGNILQLGIVHQGQADNGGSSQNGADGNEGGTLAVPGAALVTQCAEQRQHEHRQNVVQSHDHTGPGLVHTEFVGEDNGNGGVVRLPECADQKEGKANQDRALIIELHKTPPSKDHKFGSTYHYYTILILFCKDFFIKKAPFFC